MVEAFCATQQDLAVFRQSTAYKKMVEAWQSAVWFQLLYAAPFHLIKNKLRLNGIDQLGKAAGPVKERRAGLSSAHRRSAAKDVFLAIF